MAISHFSNVWICPDCRVVLEPGVADTGWWCGHCDTLYPLLLGEIPVLVSNPQRYLATTYLQYAAAARQLEHYGASLTEPGAVEAFRHNASLLHELAGDLEPQLTPASVAIASETSGSAAYTSNFRYLRRDWGGTASSESELDRLHQVLRKLASGCKIDHAAVLGAGPGRTAWDLAGWIPRVIALDKSYTMAGFFNRVMKRPFKFFDVRRSNLWNRESRVQECKAVLPPNKHRAGNERISYIVADAAAMPFPDASLDAVFSIYFTDVMPLRQLAPEIARVLKPGGYMIHFGPLDYHFDDFAASLSADEVREVLCAQGLRISREDRQALAHLGSKDEMLKTSYDNWVFIAKRDDALPNDEPAPADVLEVLPGLRLQSSVKVLMPDGREFDGGEGLPSLLSLIDGSRTSTEVAEEMETQTGTASETVLQMLLELRRFGIARKLIR